MAENENQPRQYDSVLGGQSEIPLGAAVLRGIIGVNRTYALRGQKPSFFVAL